MQEEKISSTKCDVVRFERGTDTSIVLWLFQIERNFITNSIRGKSYVLLINKRIAEKHFDEVKPFMTLEYFSIRDK